MNPLLALVAFVLLFACGQAADGSSPMEGDDASARVPGDEPAETTTRQAARTPRAPAPAAAPEWRTCQTDEDCDLRDSVCMPLEAGSPVTYCRRALAELGAPCRIGDNCELGLVCSWTGALHDESKVCALSCRDVACGLETRLPLVCGAERPAVELDARCEAE